VANCLIPTEFGSHCIHVDTTNFSVTGEYEPDFGTEEIQITYGYPKDGHWYIKRFVLGMASNQHGVPLFLQTFYGNESDKETLRTIIENLQNNLKSGEKVYHVADAAFYTEKNLRSIGQHTFWISRVPITVKDAKELINSDCTFLKSADERYSYSEYFNDYADIRQKWVLYYSVPMHEQQEKTFEKNLGNNLEKAKTSLRKILAKEFACEPDAQNAAENWLNKHPKFQFSELEILTIQRKAEKKRGRPKTGEQLVQMYKITADIEYNEAVIEQERQKLGRFVLATNDTEMSADELLTNYKAQGNVERGFRFLKDKSFRVAEVFLKKLSRIQALAMIMVLCLFLYSMTEYRLRRELERSGESVTSQTKRQTQRPTMKWIFFRLRRVREFSFVDGGRRIQRIENLNDEFRKILRLLGEEYENYYT